MSRMPKPLWRAITLWNSIRQRLATCWKNCWSGAANRFELHPSIDHSRPPQTLVDLRAHQHPAAISSRRLRSSLTTSIARRATSAASSSGTTATPSRSATIRRPAAPPRRRRRSWRRLRPRHPYYIRSVRGRAPTRASAWPRARRCRGPCRRQSRRVCRPSSRWWPATRPILHYPMPCVLITSMSPGCENESALWYITLSPAWHHTVTAAPMMRGPGHRARSTESIASQTRHSVRHLRAGRLAKRCQQIGGRPCHPARTRNPGRPAMLSLLCPGHLTTAGST